MNLIDRVYNLFQGKSLCTYLANDLSEITPDAHPDCAVGSMIIVIATKDIFIKNGDGKWQKFGSTEVISGGTDFIPGLYQTGALALYEEQGAEAIDGMLIKSWDELVSSGEIVIEDGAVSAPLAIVPLDNLPDKNEYGFYYDVPYTIPGLSYVFHEDGSVDEYECGELFDSYPAGTATYTTESIYFEEEDWITITSDGLLIDDYGEIYGLGTIKYLTGDLFIPDDSDITAVAESGFEIQGKLTGIKISDGVIEIRDQAFLGCSLLNIILPNSVKSISGASVFLNCPQETVGDFIITSNKILTQYTGSDPVVTIPEGISVIDRMAFADCDSLTEVVIPESVIWIQESAFSDCTSLTHVTGAENVVQLGSISGSVFTRCRALTSFEVPKGITKIEKHTFSSCESLTNIIIPEDVTDIGEYAFAWCKSLTSITIPSSVTIIGDYAFTDCTSLTSIIIPDSVTSINADAFAGCSALTNIIFTGTVGQWQSIAFGTRWNREVLATYVQCSDGRVNL